MSLTSENYFEYTNFMSTSLWKRFNECENLGLEGFGEPSESMLIGSYVDAYVSDTLEKFKEEHPGIISSRGPTKGQLKVGFKKAEEICEFIDNDKRLQQHLSGEKQMVMTGEIKGIPFKIMMDSYDEGIAINDLKIMASVRNKSGYIDFVRMWGYDIQGALYQEIVRQNTGEKLPFFIVAVTKEDPIDSVVIHLEQDMLDYALEQVEDTIERYWQVYKGEVEPEGCGVCKACIRKRKYTPLISSYELSGDF